MCQHHQTLKDRFIIRAAADAQEFAASWVTHNQQLRVNYPVAHSGPFTHHIFCVLCVLVCAKLADWQSLICGTLGTKWDPLEAPIPFPFLCAAFLRGFRLPDSKPRFALQIMLTPKKSPPV